MSVLQKLENQKIPYPTEGVVRTAQLDDTVAPEDSVQLAVNMNFDRVGAIQTRPGVTEYADSIDGPVRNFGTLNNNPIQPGYSNIEKSISNTFESPDLTGDVNIGQIDETHYIVFYTKTGNDGFVVVVSVDLDTGVITTLGTPLEYDATNGRFPECIKVDANHFLNFWSGTDNDGFAQVFTVNLTTWAVTATGTPLEFDTAGYFGGSVAQVDSNHFTLFYIDNSINGIVSNFEVNLTTYAVTEVGSPLTLVAVAMDYPSISPIGNGTHFIAAWTDTGDGKAQVYSVNTGTWNSTAIGSSFSFETTIASYIELSSLGDGEYFPVSWTGVGNDGFVAVLNVNQSTYAVTAAGSTLEFDTTSATQIKNVSLEDGEHFALCWLNTNDPKIQIFEVDTLTYDITASTDVLSYGTDNAFKNFLILVNSDTLLGSWQQTGNTLGDNFMSIFNFYGERLEQNLLYAQDGNSDVLNWDGATWTSVRSSLVTTEKARFVQWLDVIWMVNGNNGDPVMTSDGGAFSTTLVPTDFPKGDFISAGFEGRVWVGDKSQDVVYYSDIVQFTPPTTFTLDYNPDVNFITFSPQDGQKMTGLIEVPRALLLFKTDSIYRIYGATSVDAYPAYNVGTYSQESIIKTKTGIFFHHSSGFYQFDYGSQPIEISRRVIDFVKAIPRSYYESITGVYDGFDAVEWSVGPVTVEGVTFSNCVMRFTISTQVWTIYDYVGNTITAMISYDDGTELNHLMGTSAGLIGAMDTGTTDFDEPFYFEMIDRWRSFTPMYYQTKNIGSINVYSENAAGANIMYQIQKSGPNVWEPIGTINQKNNSLFPTTDIGDFDVLRFRIAGTTSGEPIVIHGIEIPEITIKGQDDN